ncbi:3'(2'),5'-bisphosphate nucleotidase CysQ family protein [Candidatus Pelagibacter sp.]|uniref:3'(2'),5'-bisphosphate nucleotidase CysQ family protein n=1 Tax=Candidatus Pelagibacter sp. TaxID=2024849 RepID=UPI003F853FA0
MNNLNLKEIVENLIDTFIHAGKISLDLRKQGLIKKIKADNTPVSNGDLEVNKIVTQKIKELTPELPIISEETSDNKLINNLENFWLIDPIDGTYDYINNLEEFTINAGLIINKNPVAGLIYAPSKKRMFYSYGPNNAYEFTNGETKNLNCSENFDKNDVKFVSYSNNIKPEIEKLHKKFNVKKYVRMKSSLKFCVIAAGEYDGYVAEPRACEWDIAAGHAILQHAGGIISDFDGKEIKYGKKNFQNPSLILKNKYI